MRGEIIHFADSDCFRNWLRNESDLNVPLIEALVSSSYLYDRDMFAMRLFLQPEQFEMKDVA